MSYLETREIESSKNLDSAAFEMFGNIPQFIMTNSFSQPLQYGGEPGLVDSCIGRWICDPEAQISNPPLASTWIVFAGPEIRCYSLNK